jgi:hypothetical protein
MLLEHCIRLAASRAACTAGSNNPTSIPIIAITTKSSTNVKPKDLPNRVNRFDMSKPSKETMISQQRHFWQLNGSIKRIQSPLEGKAALFSKKIN